MSDICIEKLTRAMKLMEAMEAMSASAPATAPVAQGLTPGNGRAVIVRSRDAGVEFGYLEAYSPTEVHLKNARQMWSWTAAKGGTLLDCATHGVSAGKFSSTTDKVIVFGACAIIDVTPAAEKTLLSAKWS